MSIHNHHGSASSLESLSLLSLSATELVEYNFSSASVIDDDEIKQDKDNDNDNKDEELKKELIGISKIERIVDISGKIAMKGNGGIIIKNGMYNISKFVIYNEKPLYNEISIKWIKKGIINSLNNGYILCDDKWDGEIPVIHANRYNVKFYGCVLDPSITDLNENKLKIDCNNGGVCCVV